MLWNKRARVLAVPMLLLGCIESNGWATDDMVSPETATKDKSDFKDLSLEQLMNIDVTSVSRRSEPLSQAPSAVQVVTQDEIRRSGATNLPEALRTATNLEVAQIDSHSWAISARGFNSSVSDKMLVMIDGRTVYTPLYAGVFWDVQDVFLPDIDRIEVISGPGATLWGANAVNGVIRVTSKSSKDTQGLYAEAGGGSDPRLLEGVRYGGAASNDLHYRIYEKYDNDDNTVRNNGSVVNNHWQIGKAGFRMDWDASALDLVTAQGATYDGRIAQPVTSDIVVNGGNALGRWTHRIADNSDFKLQLYYDDTYRDIPGSITERLDTYDLDFQYRLPVGARNDLVWGLGYRVSKDRLDNPPGFAFLPAHETMQWSNFFVQDQVAVLPDRVALTLGSKLEHNYFSGFEIEPSGRLAWKIDEQNTAWSAISRAVRTPSRIDTQFYAPSNPPFSVLQGNGDFKSEWVVAYELGYRVEPLPELSMSISGYYNDYHEIRSQEQINPPAPSPILLGNGLEGESYGAELSANFQVSDAWQLRAGYNELRVRLHARPGSTDTTRGGSEAQDPEHQASLHASWDIDRHWQADADLRYVSALVNAAPAYTELDLRLAWLPSSTWELSLVGQNLLHDHHGEFGPSATRQEVDRSVYGKAVWHP